MKVKLFLVIFVSGLLIFSCKKVTNNEYVTNITVVKDSTILITAPADSALVYDTVPILFSFKKKVDIIRTECYLDFSFYEAYAKMPAAIWFNANKFLPGSIHDYSLKMIAKDGSSYYSNIITLIISKLARPVVKVDFLTKSSLRLSWEDNSNDETGFRVFRKQGSGSAVQVGDLTKNSVSFIDNAIDTTKTYTYQVEVYSPRDKLTSDPLTVAFILDKYISWKNLSVNSCLDGQVALSPDGKKAVLTNYENDQVTVLDITDGSKNYVSYPGGTLGVAMAHNGTFFATGGTHGSPDRVKLWDMSSLALISTIGLTGSEPYALTMNKSDDRIVVGGQPLKIFDVATGALVKNFNVNNCFTRGVVYSADESLLLTGGNDNLVQLWNPSTGELVRTFTGHTGHVGSVCFSADESKVFSGSYEDATVRIWDKTNGALLKTITRQAGIVAIRLRPDGNIIVASSDGAVLVMTPGGQTVQEFGDSERQDYMDYNPAHDIVASYYSGTLELFREIGHWEKVQ